VKELAKLLSKVVEIVQKNPKLVKPVCDVLSAVVGSSDPVEAAKRAALAAGAKQAYRAGR
jgi:hypothetical protein